MVPLVCCIHDQALFARQVHGGTRGGDMAQVAVGRVRSRGEKRKQEGPAQAGSLAVHPDAYRRKRPEIVTSPSIDQAHLPRIDRGDFRDWTSHVVVVRIELADQLIQFQRRLPNVAEQIAADAAAMDAAPAIHGRIEAFVFGATALELPGSDLQVSSNRIAPLSTPRIEASLYPASHPNGAVQSE
jgi:hypothetical protein